MRGITKLTFVRALSLLVVSLSSACAGDGETDLDGPDASGFVMQPTPDGSVVDAGGRADAASADASAADASPDAQTVGADAVSPGAYCDPVRAWSPASATFEEEVLALTNTARGVARMCGAASFAAVKPLAMEPHLRCAARLHSQYMASSGDFSHTESANGSTFSSRIVATGYAARGMAENIASGQSTPQQVVDGWLKSEGHCKNIMNGGLTQIGVAHALRTVNGRSTPYWTQSFGTPR